MLTQRVARHSEKRLLSGRSSRVMTMRAQGKYLGERYLDHRLPAIGSHRMA